VKSDRVEMLMAGDWVMWDAVTASVSGAVTNSGGGA